VLTNGLLQWEDTNSTGVEIRLYQAVERP